MFFKSRSTGFDNFKAKRHLVMWDIIPVGGVCYM